MRRTVFIAGATGYLGRELSTTLLSRGHTVRALVRRGSEAKVAPGCLPVRGDALDASTFVDQIAPAETLVHLVGTPNPSPWKEREFLAVDLTSLRASVAAARIANIRHFVFVSVAQPAPMMKAYLRVRAKCEAVLAESGLDSTIVRPWYVLGPGHYWPTMLKPFYKLAERFDATREGAQRLGLVTLDEMTRTLTYSVEHPANGRHIVEVPEIHELARGWAMHAAAR